MTLRVGWFATARGTSSYRLLEAALHAIDAGGLDAEVAYVFCNREPGEAEQTDRFFALVRDHDIPLLTLSSVRFRKERGGERSKPGAPLPGWREEFDAEVAKLIGEYAIDAGILAGYMLIVTEAMCNRFPLLNLHPAEPGGPVGVWQDVIRQLITGRVSRSGVMIFRVTPEVDLGPPVTYCTYPIQDDALASLWREARGLPRDALEHTVLFRVLRERGVVREIPLVIETLRAFARGERRFDERLRVVDRTGRLALPLDLTPEVEAAVLSSSYGLPHS